MNGTSEIMYWICSWSSKQEKK